MTAVGMAMDVLFADQNIASDGLYIPSGEDAVPVRLIARRPDEIIGFGETRVHSETTLFDVRVSEVPEPRPGDRVTFNERSYVVQGEPERKDPDRLVWTLDVRPG
tara:strand:- start:54911 stop:55225 length:315 start_codon:yes stop_codon:yes gene_type:complete